MNRSTPAGMVYLCCARHQDNLVCIDRGTLRWIGLTEKGANGPIAWQVATSCLKGIQQGATSVWFEVARETAVHVYEPLTPRQRAVLAFLKGMEV